MQKNVRQSMFLKLINKISTRFKFLHRKNTFLAATLRRSFSFTLIMHPRVGLKYEKQIEITFNK